MKLLLLCLPLFGLIVGFEAKIIVKRAAEGKIRGCYLTNWAQYRPEPGKWTIDKYEADVCTHIFYAFAKTDASGNNPAPTEPSDLTKGYKDLKALKNKQKDLKLILSFGGASYYDFPTIAASEQNRKNFAKNVVEFAKKNGFDGVDIDWEFPTPEQKGLFTQLIKAVKAAAGKGFLVTTAVSPNAETAAKIYDFNGLKDSLDFLNIMAYDFFGSWTKETAQNAPLYGDGIFNVDKLTQFYKKSFPAKKILLGIPTYGRGWTLASSNPNQGPGSPAPSASAALPTSKTEGVLAFYEVCQVLQQGAKEKWDDKSKTPYAQKGNQWYNYDNERSVEEKTKYAKKNGLGGVFVWTLDFDDFNNVCKKQKFPLMKAIKKALA